MKNKFFLLIFIILFSIIFLNTNFVIAPHGSNCTTASDCAGTIGYKCEGGLCVEPTESDCTAAGGCWSYGYCSSPPCTTTNVTTPTTTMTCDSNNKNYCYTQTNCETAGGCWAGSSCWNPPCPTGNVTPTTNVTTTYGCSSSQPWNCYSSTDCTTAGGYWCNNYCSSYSCPVCSSSQLYNCYDTTSCTGAGGQWCGGSGTSGWCSSSCPTCSSSQPWNCYNSASCTTAGGYWCDSYCSSYTCPVCSSSQPWNCYDQTSCTTAGAKWCSYSTTSGSTAIASSGWCSSSCPICEKSQPWNCYSQTECTTAGGNWCDNYCSSYSCPKCEKSQAWNCYDSASCTTAGGYWCNNYCSSYSCPKCEKTSQWNCNDETSCKGASGNWCTTTYGYSYCESGTCPTYTCGKSEPWYCYTETDCKNTGAFWCNNYCQSVECPVCSSSQSWNCYDETSCTTAGAFWCQSSSGTGYGWCSSYKCPRCEASQTWNCNTQAECTTAGGSWCGTYCSSSCPVCSSSQPWNCYDQTSCTGTGGEWCDYSTTTSYTPSGYCTDKCPRCEESQPWNCYTENTCKTAKGEWCGTWCSDYCPICSKDNPWYCKTKGECGSSGADWCGSDIGGWCSDSCPTCSEGKEWNCYTQTDCEGAEGYWCNNYCSSYPCAECEKSQPWNCYDQTSCEGSDGNWCEKSYGTTGTYSWCDSFECPTCKEGRVYNCYAKEECETTGGNWCVAGNYCTNYDCPTVCGDEICQPGEESYCYVDCPRVVSCPEKIETNINQKEFNPGDTLSLSIKVLDKDNNPLPYTELKVNLEGFDEIGEGSLTMDSNGEYKIEEEIEEIAFSGELNIILTTDVIECPAISETLSFKINSKGFCGDRVCSEEESFESCPWDCGEDYCPELRQCPHGDTSSCIRSGTGCFCETCNLNPETLPPNCQQIKDPRTGMLTVSCEQKCAPPPSNVNKLEEVCRENGGNPVLRTDHQGCNYFDCSFSKDPNIYEGVDRCFSDAEISSVKVKCEKLGVPVKILNVGKECEIAKCEQSDDIEECPFIPLIETESIKAECKLKGLQVLEKHDENGCTYFECGTPNECVKEPAEAIYQDCNNEGGELIVRRDVNDCIDFTECLVRGDDKDVIVDIDEVPETEDLLSAVLKVEAIIVKMREIATEIRGIGDYYRSINSNEYLRFESSAVSIDSMIEEIQSSKDKLKTLVEQENVTITDVRDFLYDVEYTIEIGLKDVLWKLLSAEPIEKPVEEIKGCGFDYDCFDDAFRVCQQTTFRPEKDKGNRSIVTEITGLDENGLCIITVKVPEGEGPPFGAIDIQPPYEMTCKTPKYALGSFEPEKTLFPYCGGSLADLINRYVVTNATSSQTGNETSSILTASVIAFLDKNQGPLGCAGKLECTKVCGRRPVDCLSYIDYKLKTKSGPGGTRSINEMETYCDDNKQSCKDWFASKGISMSSLKDAKENAKYTPITGKAIRRI